MTQGADKEDLPRQQAYKDAGPPHTEEDPGPSDVKSNNNPSSADPHAQGRNTENELHSSRRIYAEAKTKTVVLDMGLDVNNLDNGMRVAHTPRQPGLTLAGKHMLANHHLKSLPCYIVGPDICNIHLCVATAPSRHQALVRRHLPSTSSPYPARGSISKHHVLKPIQSLAPPHGGGYWHKA
jgi:hypothetical protein